MKSTPELRAYFSKLGKKGSKKRWAKATKEERSARMRRMALMKHAKTGVDKSA